jgi:hypothetical protein
MSELDDLAAAAADAKQRVPVRRREPTGMVGTPPAPQVIYMPGGPPQSPPQRSAFAAGFFATFGVMAAFATMFLLLILVVVGLLAWNAAARVAESRRVREATEAAEVARAAAAARADVESPRTIRDSTNAVLSKTFTDSVALKVSVVDDEHLRVEGTNVTDREFRKVNILIWGPDPAQALASVFVAHLPARQKIDQTVRVENLRSRLRGRSPYMQIKQM